MGVIMRAVLTVFCVCNLLSAWQLLVFTEWARDSIGEPLPRLFGTVKCIMQLTTAATLIGLLACVSLWTVQLVRWTGVGKRRVGTANRNAARSEGILLMASLTSYIAVLVTVSGVVMANSRYVVNGIYMNCDGPGISRDVER
jgi:hypothetical protein